MGNDDRIDVKFGATTDELKAGADRAVGIAGTGASQIRDKFQQMSQATSQSMGQTQAVMQTGVANITSMLGGLGKVAALALGVLAGGALFKGAIQSTQEFVGEGKKLQAILGGNVNEAAALNFAYKRVGVGADEVRQAMQMLYRQMRNDEEGFDRLGVKIKNQNGEYRKTIDVYFEALEAIKKKKQGMDQYNASADAFGQRMKNMPALIKVVVNDVQNARKFLQELGMEIGPEMEKKLILFRAGMADSHMVMTAINFQIAGMLLPVLNKLGKWFAGEGPATVKAFIAVLKFIEWGAIWWGSAFTVMKLAGQRFAGETKIIFTALMDYVPNIIAFGGQRANEVWAIQMQALTNTTKFHAKQIATEIQDAKNKIDALYAGPRRLTTPKADTGESYESAKGGKSGGGGGGGKSRVQEWQEDLEQIKTEENKFLDFSKAREREFWQEKLAECRAGSNEYLQVRRNVFRLDKEMAKDAVDMEISQIRLQMEQEKTSWAQRLSGQDKIVTINKQRYGEDSRNYQHALLEKQRLENQYQQQQLRHQETLLNKEKTLAQIDVDMERDRVQYREQLGAMSGAQRVTREMQLAERSYQIERQLLERKKLLWAGYEDKVREIQEQLAILEKKKVQEMQRLEHQKTLAIKQDWQNLWQAASSSFKNAIWGWMTGTMTFAQAFTQMITSLGQVFFNMVGDMLLQWLAAMIFGKAATATQIKADAGRAYAAAFASTCAIPIIGPALAPGVAAASAALALAGGMAFLASAAQGWDVDRDALAYVHKKEMVLPPHLAEGIRGLIAGGRGGGGGVTIHGGINIPMQTLQEVTPATIRRLTDKVIIPRIQDILSTTGRSLKD